MFGEGEGEGAAAAHDPALGRGQKVPLPVPCSGLGQNPECAVSAETAGVLRPDGAGSRDSFGCFHRVLHHLGGGKDVGNMLSGERWVSHVPNNGRYLCVSCPLLLPKCG